MNLHTRLTFFAASGLISLSPGAGAMAGMTAGMRCGWQLAVGSVAGWQRGIVAMRWAVAAGLEALLLAAFRRSK